MTKKIGPEEVNVTIKFGGGLHSKASPEDIDPREAADGFNFLIDFENKNMRNRPPFDLIGTVPNGKQILGGASLLKSDGTVSTLFQAGDTVYEWNGLTTFTSVGSCNVNSKLRGHWRSHQFTLDDKVLLTDLALLDTVKEWNGTTFQSVSFTNENGSGFGNFYAKYLNVSNERAMFSNVKDGSSSAPHMIVGSARSNYQQITVNHRPSSALSDGDPLFLLTPDLKPINGLVEAFGSMLVSTEKGQIYNLTGSTATDFAFNPFYPGSAASGSESMMVIGNDVIYGRQGRIESVIDTQYFGNSRASDITSGIADQIETYNGWTAAFNSRLRHAHLFPTGQSEVWVLDTAIRDDGKISPWMKWTTAHALAFQPTFVMSMLDPLDGLEYIFMGDSSGNVFRLEGTGTNGDAGTNPVQTQLLTKLFSARLDAQAYDVSGYIKYAKNDSATVNMTFQWQGKETFDQAITVNLPAVSGAIYYGGDFYYNGDFYYGTIAGRLSRQTIYPSGQANEFQILIEAIGTTDISINEIGLRFRESTN